MNRSGLILFPQHLMKAGFQRRFGKIITPPMAGFMNVLRREGDSNPRSHLRGTTVFETAAFDHSAISPKYLPHRHDVYTTLAGLTKIINYSG
jgi:hypothetical protein